MALEHARLADRLGFHALWIAERHFFPIGTVPNPAVLLAAIAQCTESIRLGPAVSVLPLRSPIHVAEDYALVDLLSGGRLDLGVGTGAQSREFDGHGIDFDDRRRVFDARLAEIRRRWKAAAAGERGPDALNVAPVQTPTPPIYVATMTEEGAHAVGLQGDSMLTLVSPATSNLSEIAARVDAHARGLADGGHPASCAEAAVAAFAVAAESEESARAVGVPAMGGLLQAMQGAAPHDSEGIYQQMRQRGTGLFGSFDAVGKQIERYVELGAGQLALISRFGSMPAEAAERTLRALSPRSPNSVSRFA
jgi:alkanesulfonate monooxygenase SsuD/methylene tetrahydromethanopterin reductase-like flavin-dependent oxidoreductase (luciferase family)